jgi:hypothetical protein
MKVISHVSCLVLILAGLSLVTVLEVNAQSSEQRPGTTVGVRPGDNSGRLPDSLQPPNIRERQMVLLQMEIEAAKPRTPEEQKLALQQISEDYKKIQIINNKMISDVIPSKAPDYKYVGEMMSEIRKRASRLKFNLRLPKPDEKIQRRQYKHAKDIPSLRAALLLLDQTIMSFVNNPVFTNTDVINVNHASQLGVDLETIVEFTKELGRDTELLSKASSKSHN